jgi:hypothetical protein
VRVIRHHRSRDRGQGMMEFALVAPILLVLVFGVFDFGRGMSANVTVANSAREGARYMAASSTTATAAAPNYWGFGDCPGAPVNGVPASPTAGATLKAWRQLQADNLTLVNVQFIAYFYHSDPTSDPNRTSPSMSITCPADQSSTVPTIPVTAYTPATTDWVIFEIKYSYKPSTPLISAFIKNGVVSLDQITTMVMD